MHLLHKNRWHWQHSEVSLCAHNWKRSFYWRTMMLRSFSFCRERAVVFGACALLGFGLDVERNGDLPRERERPDRDADREGDVRCATEEGAPAVEAEGDRADCGCDTDVDGVFGGRDGGGSCRLACGDVRRLRAGYLGEGGGEGDRTRRPFPLMWT